jgi:hypothetical protein
MLVKFSGLNHNEQSLITQCFSVLFAMYVACNPSIEKQCIPLSLKMVIEKWSSELWFEKTDCWTRDHVIIAKQAWSNKSIEKKCIPLSLKIVIEKWSSELWFMIRRNRLLNEGPCHHHKASVIEKVDRNEVQSYDLRVQTDCDQHLSSLKWSELL